MPKEETNTNGTRSRIVAVSIYFTDRKDLFPTGVYFAFQRQYGKERKYLFNTGSTSSWLRLSRLIDKAPGRLITAINGLTWWPHKPDFFRLDGPRMHETILDILEEGDWKFDDPDVGWVQQRDFASQVVDAMRSPD